MFDALFGIIKPYLSRVAGAVAGYIAAILAAHQLPLAATDVQTIVAFLMLVFTVFYGVIHKIIDHYINPSDAAHPAVAAGVQPTSAGGAVVTNFPSATATGKVGSRPPDAM